MTDVQDPPAPPAGSTRRWAALAGVAALTLLGAVLRLIPLPESGLWRDEVSSMVVAGMPTAREIVVYSRLNEPHPPLYYLVLHYWLDAFGHTTEAGLALSLLFGIALIPLTWLAGRRLFSPAAGVVAALLVACSPELIRYSGFLRPYSILPVLVVGSTGALWAALTRGGAGRWAAYAGWTATMLAMNYWPVLIVAAQALVAAGWLLWADPARRHHFRRVVAAVLVLGALAAPVAARLLDPSRISGHPPKPVPPWDPFIALARVSTGLPFVFALPVFAALLAAAALWLRRHGTERRGEVLALGLTLGVAVVSMVPAWVLSHKVNMLQVRFLLMPTPLVALAAGWVLVRLFRTRRVAAIVLLEALVAGNLLEWHFDRFVHSNGRELAAAVRAQARPSDLIVFAPSWVGASFWYYYRGKNTMVEFPILHGHASSVGGVATAMASPTSVDEVMAQLAPARAEGRRVWLIMERRAITDSVKYIDPREAQTDASYSRTAIGRSNELRRALAGLYGPPDTTAVPPDTRPVGELLQALLFGR